MTQGWGRTQGTARGDSGPAKHDYWLSYSDLMAGLLMVFTLMLLVALLSYQSGIEGVREMLMVRQEVVDSLRKAFEDDDDLVIEVQPDGTIRFADRVLFEEGRWELSPQGEEQLASFAHKYVGVLFGRPQFAPFREQLEALVIEGHTNDNGTYEYNLALSQARASTVMGVLLNVGAEYQRDLQRYVTANGRSFAALVCRNGEVDFENSVDPDRRCADRGGVDKEASRRIEIRFQLHDGELLAGLLELLDNR